MALLVAAKIVEEIGFLVLEIPEKAGLAGGEGKACGENEDDKAEKSRNYHKKPGSPKLPGFL